MIKKSLIIGMMCASFLGMSQTQCGGITKDSVNCKNTTKSTTELCHLHDSTYQKDTRVAQVCSGTTKVGKSCKSRTKNESGLCYRHEEN